MQVDRNDFERNLPRKSFIQGEGDHRYFYHEFEGKRTGPYTYTSRGSAYKVYGPSLLARMKTQLRLDTIREVVDLCECPISAEDYNEMLRKKGVF